MKRYCYANSIENFLNEEKSNWLNKMKKNFRENYNVFINNLFILSKIIITDKNAISKLDL